MPIDINTIALSLPSSDPNIRVGQAFTLRIGTTEIGTGIPEIATLNPAFSTDDMTFADIPLSNDDLTAAPATSTWVGAQNYDYTITAHTPGTYYVRGESSGENSGVLNTASQLTTIQRRRIIVT